MNTNHLTIVILSIVILFFIIKKGFPFLKNLFWVLKNINRPMKQNNNPQETLTERKQIALSAIYSEQQSAYINSLSTGLPRSRILTILNEWWGIHNSEEAVNKIDYLTYKGFQFYFPIVLEAFEIADPQQREIFFEEQFIKLGDQDCEKILDQTANLELMIDEFVKDKLISNTNELKKMSVAAWDIGRAIFLSRLCYDVGFISIDQVRDYLQKNSEIAFKQFGSWHEFAKSYVIGRAHV
jgi:hypothetical protein